MRQLAFASPIILTTIWASALLASGLWPMTAIRAGAGFLLLGLPIAWAYAVFRMARTVLVDRGEPAVRADWVFLLALVGLLATTLFQALSGLPEKPDAQSTAEMPLVLLIFASVGVAGRTLDRAEGAAASTAVNRALLNAIVLLLQPVGFRVLRRRLLALNARPNP